MGLCGSVMEDASQSPQQQQQHGAAVQSDSPAAPAVPQGPRRTLLLLGTGDSGKSTLVRQARRLYGGSYSERERASVVPAIHRIVLRAIKALCSQCDVPLVDPPQLQAVKDHFASIEISEGSDATVIDENIAANIQALWVSPQIQEVFLGHRLGRGGRANKPSEQIADSAAYFLDRVAQIGTKDYSPSDEDIVRSCEPTRSPQPKVGVGSSSSAAQELQVDLAAEGCLLRLVDVGGGGRSSRKDWVHHFQAGCDALVFVVGLGDFDEPLGEDPRTTKLAEQLKLWDEICNSRWFRETPMMLVLNKRDLFAAKLRSVPLSSYFPSYSGSDDLDAACAFMRGQFESKNRNPDKHIHTCVTSAALMDSNGVAELFKEVRDILQSGDA